uniref:Nudix hydrolase domain-containing protein n=1 Tax=Panagrolaimus sp. PS1159 TaxID=55785 RepID=A0AC35EXU3_9BILA
MFSFLESANKYFCNVEKSENQKNHKLNFELRTSNSGEIWIMAEETKIANQFGVDGVDVIPILKKDNKKYIILIKQFRPPIRKWIIEFPSGYIDGSDKSIEEAGIRELKEETGYTVTKVIQTTKNGQYLNPSVTSDLDAIMIVEIDGNNPINKNPKQSLDESEEVSEVIQIEYEKLLEFCDKIIEKGEIEISTQVYTFALSSLF